MHEPSWLYDRPAFAVRFLKRRGLARQLATSDKIIVTSWESAEFLFNNLNRRINVYYFVQHYEIWPLWRTPELWRKGDELRNPEDFADLYLEDEGLARYKSRVDATYEYGYQNIITSSWEKKVFDRLGVPYIGYAFYGVNFEKFFPEGEKTKKVVSALFRGKSEKGDKDLIDCIEFLGEIDSEIQVLLFGPQPPMRLPTNVKFFRNPSQDQIRKIFSMSEVMVYTSFCEGWGMPPMEAMACRNAIVTTPVGAVPDYLPKGGAMFINPHDGYAAAIAVQHFFFDRDKLTRAQELNYNAIKDWSWEQATERFMELCGIR